MGPRERLEVPLPFSVPVVARDGHWRPSAPSFSPRHHHRLGHRRPIHTSCSRLRARQKYDRMLT